MYKVERHKSLNYSSKKMFLGLKSLGLVVKVRIENKLGTKLWIYEDRIDNEVFSMNLPNANGLNIVNVILT